MVSAAWVGMAVPVPLGALPCERWRRGVLLAAYRMLVASRTSRVPRLDPDKLPVYSTVVPKQLQRVLLPVYIFRLKLCTGTVPVKYTKQALTHTSHTGRSTGLSVCGETVSIRVGREMRECIQCSMYRIKTTSTHFVCTQ